MLGSLGHVLAMWRVAVFGAGTFRVEFALELLLQEEEEHEVAGIGGSFALDKCDPVSQLALLLRTPGPLQFQLQLQLISLRRRQLLLCLPHPLPHVLQCQGGVGEVGVGVGVGGGGEGVGGGVGERLGVGGGATGKTAGTVPLLFGDDVERGRETEGVEASVAVVTEEHLVVFSVFNRLADSAGHAGELLFPLFGTHGRRHDSKVATTLGGTAVALGQRRVVAVEVVVEGDLLPDLDVLDRKDPHTRLSQYIPLLCFAVRVTTVIDQPRQVPLLRRVDHQILARLHQIRARASLILLESFQS